MKQERPLLIVTSCTRNYGWVTRAFLEGNTRWADYIVIVDQMSTDGTREMCVEYKNVVLVDDPDMTYKENTRAKMGFMKGRELAAGRDAIYFALDIDEVMPANWMKTEDGKKILASKPGDMYQIEWANIMPDGKTYVRSGWQYKIFHDNGMDWQEVNGEMHTPLLPYTTWETIPEEIHDFPLIHFGEYHQQWIHYKLLYYQMLDVHQRRSKSAISIYRTYHEHKGDIATHAMPIDNVWQYPGVDIVKLVDVTSEPIFIDYMRELVKEDGIKRFWPLDIWDADLQDKLLVHEKCPLIWRMFHYYLRVTQPYCQKTWCRAIDKILRSIV